MKNRLSFLILTICLGLSCNPQKRPNVVLIFVDDLGYGDLSCYGNTQIQTPNIDKIAESGMRFTQFYANAPVCSPSRVAITTGQYPARWGIYTYLSGRPRNADFGMVDYLDGRAPSLARLLQSHGYATGHFGKWHMGGGRNVGDAPLPQALGFDRSLVSFEGLGERILDKDHGLSKQSAALEKGPTHFVETHEKTAIYVDSALAFIERHQDRPFYVNLWPNDVHDPFKPIEGGFEEFLPIARDTIEAKFFAVLSEMDSQIGRFIVGLEQMNVLKNTMIIFTSDNGPTDWPFYYRNGGLPPSSQGELRGRKWSLYEGGIRVPFMIQWKDKIPAGQTNSQTAGVCMDLFPSICSMLGIPLPTDYGSDGIDLSQAFYGDEMIREENIFWYYNNVPKPGNASYISPEYALRSGKWKFLINADGSEAQMYDLQDDPKEEKNLVKEKASRANAFTQKINNWKRMHVPNN